MSDQTFDPNAMVRRFHDRAEAVRRRGIPPIEGPERQRFIQQAQDDYMDFAIIADSTAEISDGVLTLRIDLQGANGNAE
jgi:limonene-1,2-epoxide hydrolase